MGLDQYLLKKTYVKNWGYPGADKNEITVKKNGEKHKSIKPERIANITEDVGYWRKFNALHSWFVNNCQDGNDDCGEHYVSEANLKKLLETLKEIDTDNSKADELLPTQSGFFFGGTEYDEYYFEQVKETIKLLEDLIAEGGGDFYYYASW